MPFSQPGAGCGAEPGAPGQLKERQRSLRVGHEGSKGWKCCSQCPGLVLCCCCSHCGYNNKDAALFLSPQEVPAVWVAVCSPQGLPRARAPSPHMCLLTCVRSHSLLKAYSHFSQKMALGFTETEPLGTLDMSIFVRNSSRCLQGSVHP